MSFSRTSSFKHEKLTIMLYRDSPQDRLGIRFASTTPEDPPFVKAITGVAQHSDLKVNDIILKVDGKDASNSVVATALFSKAGTSIELVVHRPAEHHAVMMNRRESAAAATKTLVIARNDVGLGLIVDSDNTISDLVPGSAASKHGDFQIGQRIVAVNGTPLPPNSPLAPLIPPGPDPMTVTVVAAFFTPAVAPVVAPRPQLPGGSSMASLIAATHEVEQRHAGPGGSRGSILQQQQSASEGPLVAPKPLTFSSAQLSELNKAFEVLSADCGRPDGKIGPAEVLAAVTHFHPDASLKQVTRLCRRHATGGENAQFLGLVDQPGFHQVMADLAKLDGPTMTLVDLLDAPGLGFASREDAKAILQALHQQGGVKLTADDLAAMMGALKPAKDGLVHRVEIAAALKEALGRKAQAV